MIHDTVRYYGYTIQTALTQNVNRSLHERYMKMNRFSLGLQSGACVEYTEAKIR